MEKHPVSYENLLARMQFSYIANIMGRFLKLDNPNLLDNYNRTEPIFLKLRLKVLDKMMNILNDSEVFEEIYNVCNVLSEVISKTNRINAGRMILEEINEKYLEKFILQKLSLKVIFLIIIQENIFYIRNPNWSIIILKFLKP